METYENKVKEIEAIIRMQSAFTKAKENMYIIDGEKFYPVEMIILSELRKDPELGVAHLAEELSVTKSAISQKIKVMCEKEYLYFREKVGKRKHFEITEKGEEICRIHDQVIEKLESKLIDCFLKFDKTEREIFLKILNEANSVLEKFDYQDYVE